MRRSNVRLCSISSLIGKPILGWTVWAQLALALWRNKNPAPSEAAHCTARNGSLPLVGKSDEGVPTLVPKA